MQYRILLISLLFFVANCSQNKSIKITYLDNPVDENSSLSRLYTDDTGAVFMSWVEQDQDSAHLFYSEFTGKNWTDKTYISGSDSWFVNWADFPSIISNNGKVTNAHWLQKIPGGTYAYQVVVASAENDWDTNLVPHKDDTPTEHGFVSMVPYNDSSFMSIWLDGRNTGGHGHDSHSEGSLTSAMTLRSAIIDQNLEVESSHLIDSSVCDCCGTAAVKTNDGYLVAYRNRTENEIRDIYTARFKNGSWENPELVHNDGWNIAACPVNGPAIASSGDMVALAWYTAANDSSKVKIAVSEDNGYTFSSPVTVSGENSLGRVDIEILENKMIAVSWMDRNNENRSMANFEIKLFDENLTPKSAHTVASIASSRRTGFPQLSHYNGNLVTSWTSLDESGSPKVHTALIEIE